jgi:hypothetical protein
VCAEGAPSVKGRALWRNLVEAERDFFTARHGFVTEADDRVGIIQQALHKPSERGAALRVLLSRPIPESQALFDDLVQLASVGHADLRLCQELIVRMPRSWVLSKIEASAERLLSEGTDEEYRRLLELYFQLDNDLTMRLASRAASHRDENISEAGRDFLRLLRR